MSLGGISRRYSDPNASLSPEVQKAAPKQEARRGSFLGRVKNLCQQIFPKEEQNHLDVKPVKERRPSFVRQEGQRKLISFVNEEGTKLTFPVEPKVRRPSLKRTDTMHQTLSVTKEDGTTMSFAVQGRSSAKLPDKAGEKTAGDTLRNWLAWQDFSKSPNRVPYDPKIIDQVLKEEFQDKYHCSWKELKSKCSDPVVLQIVNDLRSAYLEEVFTKVKGDFPDVKIYDFGSTKLTSDRDFSFELGKAKQSEEAKVVASFNKHFQEIWKTTSATVFDSNGYTMQYLSTASDPNMEAERSQLQHMGSLLMKLRTSTPEAWELYKKQTLEKLPPEKRAAKNAEFHEVENQNEQLELLFNKQLLRSTVKAPPKTLSGTVQDYQAKGLNTLTPTEINEAAGLIRQSESFEDLQIDTSNALHETYKTSFEALENQRNSIVKTMKTAYEASEMGDFRGFASSINVATHANIRLQQQLLKKERNPDIQEKIQTHIAQLERSLIRPGDQEVMSAYKGRIDLENREKELTEKRKEAESDLNQMQVIENRMTDLFKELQKGGSSKDLDRIQSQIEKMKAKLSIIQQRTGVSHNLRGALNENIQKMDQELLQIQNTKTLLHEKFGESYVKAGGLGLQADRLLIDMQRSNLIGMCFAQEAHGSEGAFASVVKDIQADQEEVRSLNQSMQAMREISGFYSGHQVHQETPVTKLVEASKYADRLFIIKDTIGRRTEALHTRSPQIEGMEDMGKFFKELSKLRGTGKTEEELERGVNKALKDCNLTHLGTEMNESTMMEINKQMEGMISSFEAWYATLSPKEQNAMWA